MAKGRSTSRWRREADRVIAEALSALPDDATEGQKKAAIRAAYPFGQRSHLPYRHWLAAQRAALAPVKAKAEAPPVVRLALQRRPGRLWLLVECGWCKGAQWATNGCIVCARLYPLLVRALQCPDVKPLLTAGADDDTAAQVALDAVEEATGERPHLPEREVAKKRGRMEGGGE